MRIKNLVSMRFGNLIVTEFSEISKHGKARWKCQCDCGKNTIVVGSSLVNGGTKSCGCMMRHFVSLSKIKHGMCRTHEYYVWCAMIRRCSSPNDPAYHNYGGRGIHVCERWKSFIHFIEDMGSRPSAKHTIERMNNKNGYSPENCTWEIRKKQSRNTRQNKLITYMGKTQCLADWTDEFGIDERVLRYRASKGWDFELALNKPIRKNQPKRAFVIDRETISLPGLAKKYGIKYITLFARLKRGMDIAEAIETPVKKQNRT